MVHFGSSFSVGELVFYADARFIGGRCEISSIRDQNCDLLILYSYENLNFLRALNFFEKALAWELGLKNGFPCFLNSSFYNFKKVSV